MPPVPTQRLFGVSVSGLDMAATVERIIHWSGRRPARNVVTTNLDHVMKLRTDPRFRRVYEEADLVTADGMPFVWMSEHEGTPLPGRVTGSDMIGPVMQAAAAAGRRVFLFGSTMERLHTAAKRLKADNPRLEFAGAYAPPFGFDRDPDIQAELTQMIRTVRPDIILVALGAPKQEMWSARMADNVRHGVFLNIGGGLDFLSGEIRRAPAFMQKMGLEWLWRASTEPFRLGGRYLGILVRLPGLYRMHKRDRARFRIREQRRMMALEAARPYSAVRTATREAERERALRARAGF
ncbi:WecB/TagA/CpsF family glycosyltransferase [Acuticoccus sp. MNP-M23]|uniref:WecB/TagA/CpsF family glycosyltransferase n=1 Tax=Acuticoccus sp. MNP-M23 TaxID=3072793 RepID=UPI0028153D28|nr:WecB/TagA/CpsF family glycosyltransferase [Acuticoccus sp. MNP-M23]WMS44299.1 WecB/TagA/CpsF family glycosyltransferase [Acuticoccus sp. MNP-M23]